MARWAILSDLTVCFGSISSFKQSQQFSQTFVFGWHTVKFRPPYTTPLIQMMDQQDI